MKFGKIAAASVALSLTAAPAMAQASQSAASVERLGASIDQDSKLAGSNVLIGIVVIAAIIGAIVVVADGNDNNEPVSP